MRRLGGVGLARRGRNRADLHCSPQLMIEGPLEFAPHGVPGRLRAPRWTSRKSPETGTPPAVSDGSSQPLRCVGRPMEIGATRAIVARCATGHTSHRCS